MSRDDPNKFNGCHGDDSDFISRRSFLGSGAAVFSFIVLNSGLLALAENNAAPGKFSTLAGKISGQVIIPEPSKCTELRSSMLWNSLVPERMPEVIVRAANEKDIVEAIQFARREKLKVSVIGGGHNFYGLAFRNGGMLIDLSSLKEVSIDAQTMTASIQPTISNAEFARQLAALDLAFPVGHCPDVRMSGYLLNGGFPFNSAHWGPACDSVEALELVTADGRILKASAKENADLFWAARGAGPEFFAVVTRFHLKLHRLPKAMMESTYFFDYDQIKDVANEVAAIAPHLPENMELTIALPTAPPFLTDECHKHDGRVCVFSATAFAYTEQEALASLEPFEQSTVFTRCLSKKVKQASSFPALFAFHEKLFPEHHRYQVELMCSDSSPSDVLGSVSDLVRQAPSSKSVIGCIVAPASKKLLQPHSSRSFSMSGNLVVGSWSIWEESANDDANRQWQESILQKFKPFTNQHYIGETDLVTNRDHVRNAYQSEQWDKLQTLRSQYDPDGLFFRLHEGMENRDKPLASS